MTPVVVEPGDGPVVLALPHVGTDLPAEVMARLNPRGRALADTDWHLDRLYAGLLPGATVLRATQHRYAIDVNRPPDGASLYPGQATTGLIPETDFDGDPIWDAPPTPTDAAARLAAIHAPYHARLAAELDRLRAAHGVAILWDAHSIRSRIPRLFAGRLPDLSLGTNDGASCAPAVAAAVAEIAAASGFTWVRDGRFKGGWTTRHHGRPAAGVHAVQMEIAQSAYLVAEVPPWIYDEAKAARLRGILAAMLAALAALAPRLEAR
jgi:formiminoglutamase